jgi:hypothetical protein
MVVSIFPKHYTLIWEKKLLNDMIRFDAYLLLFTMFNGYFLQSDTLIFDYSQCFMLDY